MVNVFVIKQELSYYTISYHKCFNSILMDYSILAMKCYLNIKTRVTYNMILVAQVSYASFE